MTCDQATFMLERRWDHALSQSEELALDEHIGGCAACREEADAIAMADVAFLRLPDVAPPVDITAAVCQRIAAEAPAERGRGWFWGALVALSVLVAGLFSLGISPLALLDAPIVAAVSVPVAHAVRGWVQPIVLALEAMAPAYGTIASLLGVVTLVEACLLGLWVSRQRHGRQVARPV